MSVVRRNSAAPSNAISHRWLYLPFFSQKSMPLPLGSPAITSPDFSAAISRAMFSGHVRFFHQSDVASYHVVTSACDMIIVFSFPGVLPGLSPQARLSFRPPRGSALPLVLQYDQIQIAELVRCAIQRNNHVWPLDIAHNRHHRASRAIERGLRVCFLHFDYLIDLDMHRCVH